MEIPFSNNEFGETRINTGHFKVNCLWRKSGQEGKSSSERSKRESERKREIEGREMHKRRGGGLDRRIEAKPLELHFTLLL